MSEHTEELDVEHCMEIIYGCPLIMTAPPATVVDDSMVGDSIHRIREFYDEYWYDGTSAEAGLAGPYGDLEEAIQASEYFGGNWIADDRVTITAHGVDPEDLVDLLHVHQSAIDDPPKEIRINRQRWVIDEEGILQRAGRVPKGG